MALNVRMAAACLLATLLPPWAASDEQVRRLEASSGFHGLTRASLLADELRHLLPRRPSVACLRGLRRVQQMDAVKQGRGTPPTPPVLYFIGDSTLRAQYDEPVSHT